MIRPFMDAVKRRQFFFREMACDRFVGGDHEFFNYSMGDVALGADDVFRHALQVENDFRFRQIEIEIASDLAVVEDQ